MLVARKDISDKKRKESFLKCKNNFVKNMAILIMKNQ